MHRSQAGGRYGKWVAVVAVLIGASSGQACINTGTPLEPCHCMDKMAKAMSMSMSVTPTLTGAARPADAASAVFNAIVGDIFYDYNGNMTGDVTIHAGDTVNWSDNGFSAHTITSVPNQPDPFDSGVIFNGATFQHTFMTPGTYVYYCEVHSFINDNGMAEGPQVGTVTVLPVPEPASGAILIIGAIGTLARQRRRK